MFGDGVAREEVYGVHFNNVNWANVRLMDVLDDFFELLNAIVESWTQFYEGHDLVRIYISNRAFNVPVTAGLIPLRDFDVASILQRLEEILQSETDLVLEEGLEMHIAVIRLPRGNGLEYIHGDGNILRKTRGVSEIVAKNLYLARSIVVALSKTELWRPSSKEMS